MTPPALQSLCETGQQQLMLMDYLAAEEAFLQAEKAALELADFDTLSRLYMPLQEARRQRRQRCGEGTVNLDLLASGPDDPAIDPQRFIEQYPQGQLLIAGWGSVAPALRFRELAREKRLYSETYLGAVYPTASEGRVVVIVALPDALLPLVGPRSIEELRPLLPTGSIVIPEKELPKAPRNGDIDTYARTMALWEQLHTPFLASADAEVDALRKMDAYRKAIAVDYACELAHQKLSAVAREYARQMGRS